MTPQNRTNLLAAYAPERIGKRYGVKDPIYTMKGYHRGQDVRKQDPTESFSVVTDVIAIDGGKVVYVGRPNDLVGLTVVIDTGRPKGKGRYESHSHNYGVLVKVGDKVQAGQKLARNASMSQKPGLIKGVHDHITITDYLDGAWMNRPEYDPLPYIQAAVAAATPQEDDVDITQRKLTRKTKQVLQNGKAEYLKFNDEGNVTVAQGPLKIVGGVLGFYGPHEGGPFDDGGYVPVLQIQAVIDVVDADGKVTKSTRVGEIAEAVVSLSNSFPQFAVPPVELAKGQRLRFKVAPFGIKTFTITAGTLNLVTAIPVGK